MADNPPDHLIAIPRNKCGTLEFDRSAEMVEYGYRLAEEQLLGKL
jgi:NTE family protein